MVDNDKLIDTESLKDVGLSKEYYSPTYVPKRSSVNSHHICQSLGNNWFSGWIYGKRLNVTTGLEYNSLSGAVSDFISIDVFNNYFTLDGLNPNLYTFVAFYDSNKEFIFRSSAGAYSSFSIHTSRSDVAFIRINSYENNGVTTGNINDLNDYDTYLSLTSLNAEYEPYEGCLYGLELYDMIESNFITSNFYLNCGIIALFLALIVILVNAPFLFIRKIKGD